MDCLIAAEMAEVQNPMKALNNLIAKDVSADSVSDNVIAADTTRYWNPLERFRLEASNFDMAGHHHKLPDLDAELENQNKEFERTQNECTPPLAAMPKPRPLVQINAPYDATDSSILDLVTLGEEKNNVKGAESRKRSDISETKHSSSRLPASKLQVAIPSTQSALVRNKIVHSSRAKNGDRKQEEPKEPQEADTAAVVPALTVVWRARDQLPHRLPSDAVVVCPSKTSTNSEQPGTAADSKTQHATSREKKEKSPDQPTLSSTLAVSKRVLTGTRSYDENQGKLTNPQPKQNIFQKVLRSPFTKRQKAQHSDHDSHEPV